MRAGAEGFTLLEILVVLAIIGILAGIFGWNLIRSIRSAELREATAQVATDLRRARSQAQRGSANMQVKWSQNSDGEATAYSVNGSSRALPHNVRFTCSSGCSAGAGNKSFTYMAPYGEMDATGTVLKFTSPANVLPLEIRVVGVTGKVIVTQGTP